MKSWLGQKPKQMTLPISKIEATAATQVRAQISKDTVNEYAQDLKDGAVFPHAVVFREANTDRFILADGFHRLLAHVEAEFQDITVNIYDGTMHDALVYALGANAQHGLRRSQADKRNSVMMALKDPELSQLKITEIADLCHVHERTVYRIQRDMVAPKPKPEPGPNNPDGEKAQPNTPDNLRPSKELTQEQVDRDEVRQAIGLIKNLPYAGSEAAKLEFTAEDLAGLEYVSEWTAIAVAVSQSG